MKDTGELKLLRIISDWLRALQAAKLYKSVSIRHVPVSSGSTDMFAKLQHIHHVNPLYVIRTGLATPTILKQVTHFCALRFCSNTKYLVL
jgi:hypothetical protein